jgi:abortive infection bacteriophage resistance protein
MELKKPLSFKQQVEQLVSHGMIVRDHELAESIISRVSYYRFTGYALQFRVSPTCSEYMENTDFETIYHIYEFDTELRHLLRLHIERIELYFRVQIVHGFCMKKCLSSPHNQHYDQANFYKKEGYQKVMESIEREQNYYSDSLIAKHHKEKYDSKMPLWAIVEFSSFSNLSKLYSAMYNTDQESIAKNMGISRNTLSNHLHCLSVMRNKCAHAARLYGNTFTPYARFNSAFLRSYPELKNNSLFSYLLVIIKRQPLQEYREQLIVEIISILEKYKRYIDLELLGCPVTYEELLTSKRFYSK